jgi:Calcineurin-like phosphoesterase
MGYRHLWTALHKVVRRQSVFSQRHSRRDRSISPGRSRAFLEPSLLVVLGGVALSALIMMVAAPQTSGTTSDPVIAAAGDIACDERPGKAETTTSSTCQQAATAAVVTSLHPAAVLAIGDEQYPSATLAQFMASYDRTWGAFKNITHPAPGNHEYETPNARGYFDYFGASAGPQETGYYSFELGGWHLIALNGNCSAIGGCQSGSAQERWLAADLAAHPAACTIAYWHQPRFSSGVHHSDRTYQALWQDLYAAHADVVLAGHDHDYERFAPQDPQGRADPKAGIREFVVGTGGKSHYPFTLTENNSEVRNDESFGVLSLTLHAHGYDWRFIPAAGSRLQDAGSGACHGR